MHIGLKSEFKLTPIQYKPSLVQPHPDFNPIRFEVQPEVNSHKLLLYLYTTMQSLTHAEVSIKSPETLPIPPSLTQRLHQIAHPKPLCFCSAVCVVSLSWFSEPILERGDRVSASGGGVVTAMVTATAADEFALFVPVYGIVRCVGR